MTAATFSTIKPSDDAALVSASRGGDREAFGQIVRKYQGMIAGLIYASVGDVHRSEDLAQETFLSAWKSLSGLREPAKLAAWLCQIARHRILDHVRSAGRQKTNFSEFLNQPQPSAALPADAEIISAEENELLWRTLSQMPQPYRETLVLYYRQNQSTANVAAAMETTEAAVRQRLTRGREMMRENLAQLLEKNLSRTAPSEAFTAAVVSALPASLPIAFKSATLGGIAKGSATASGTGFLAIFSIMLAPIIAMYCGIVGARANLRSAQNPREWRFMVRFQFSVFLLVIVGTALLFCLQPVAQHFNLKGKTYLTLYAFAIAGIYGLVIPFVYVGEKMRTRIRLAEGLPATPTMPPVSHKFMFWAITGGTVAGFGWMIDLAQETQDWLSFGLLLAATVIIIAWAHRGLRGRDVLGRYKFSMRWVAAQGIVTLIMLNWRFHYWLATLRNEPIEVVKQRLPYWVLNLLIVVIWSSIIASLFVTMRQKTSTTSEAPESQRSSPAA